MIFAALVVLICVGFLVHMLLPAARRRRLDEVVRAFRQLVRAVWSRLLGKTGSKPGNKSRNDEARPNKGRRSGVPRAVRLVDQPSANMAKLEPKPPVPAGPSADVSADVSADDSTEPLDAEAQKAAEKEAEIEALDIIDRARRQARDGKPVDRDGNVYRPDAFKPRPPPHDKLH